MILMKWMHSIKKLKILKSKFFFIYKNILLLFIYLRFCFENAPLETREKVQVNVDRCFVRQA
jgi:hypothetical protein